MSYFFAHGSGTEADPYQVWTAEDLNGVRDYLSAHFIQMADIDLSGWGNWLPIGAFSDRWPSDSDTFIGSYDGNNFKIVNLLIDYNDPPIYYYDELGLFCYVGGVFKNIILENINIVGYWGNGGLIGRARLNTVITNCHVNGYLYSEGGAGGLLIGNASGNIFPDIIITDCSTLGDIKGDYGDLGGLIGWAWGTIQINNSHSNANIISTGEPCGGLVGSFARYGNINCTAYINNCYATGDVYAEDGVGGLIGFCAEGYINKCYAIGNMFSYAPGWSGAGGFIGQIWEGEIRNSYCRGNAEGSCSTGGFAGIGEDVLFENCYSIGKVEGTVDEGGFIGSSYGCGIINCYYDSETSGQSDNDGRGEPRTTAEMTYPYDTSVNQTYVDWDFGSIWHHDYRGSLNDGYPQFEITAPLAVKKFIFKVPYKI